MYYGTPQNDIGLRTDVMDNVKKSMGMTMLIRSMAPKVIVADEIGTNNEIDAIKYAVCSGIKGIFTAHGKDFLDLKVNPALNELIKSNVFERIIFLKDGKEKGEIDKVYVLNKKENKYDLI